MAGYLKLVNLLFIVSKLLQDTAKLALVLGANLVAGDGFVHARRAADKDLELLALLGLRQNRLQQLLGDVPLALCPLLRGVVEGVESTETLGVGILELVKLLLKEDVILGEVAVDESDLRLILRVLEDGADQLVHGGNSGAASDKRDVLVLVRRPWVLGERALKVETLAGSHTMQMFRHGTVGIPLDDQVNEAGGIYRV